MSTRFPILVTAPPTTSATLRVRRSDDSTAAIIFDDATTTSATTQPVAIAAGASATKYVDGPSVYYVSAIVDGIEMAGGYGSRRRVEAEGGLTRVDVAAGPVSRFRWVTVAGTLSAAAGALRYRFPTPATILGISLDVATAPTGAAILVDVNKNGTTIFTTQGNRPTVAISAFATAAEVTNMEVTSFAAGDYLTVDVDQIGSTVEGANLTVTIRYQ